MNHAQQYHNLSEEKVNKKSGSTSQFTMINPHAAGIDVATEEMWVAVPADRATPPVRKFGAFTSDLHAIADWLLDCHITTVAMESTGVYWIPLYQILEKRGFQVCLVNARHLKNVPNRPKTDRLDCQWIQRLHSYGLLPASFRPTDEMCRIRAIQRHRENLIRQSARHSQHRQKALHQMNLLLDKVISDITGVTGMAILQRILDGERNPVTLAKLRNPHIKSSADEMAKALDGDYREEHLFVLRQAVEAYRFVRGQIRGCDHELDRLVTQVAKRLDAHQTPLPPSTRVNQLPRDNDFTFDARTAAYEAYGVDLTQVPGIQATTALGLLAELGQDVRAWPTVKHFTSWLGLSPNKKVSGGKTKSSQTRKVHSRAARLFRIAARAAGHAKHSYLGACYQRLKARLGGPKAITATARKLAVIVYQMITKQTPYQEHGDAFYLKQHEHRTVARLKKQAALLGWTLTPMTPDNKMA
jgi:transposase